MLIEISSIKGNSGAGSPVFSKPGLMHNTMYMAFNKDSKPRPPPVEEGEFDFHTWKRDMAEMQNKEKFQKELARFEAKKKRVEQQDKMLKQGLSKSVTRKDDQDKGEGKPKRKEVPLIGDIKKDKLKNSLGMTNEEKEKLVAREKDMSRNRGICMVSSAILCCYEIHYLKTVVLAE